MSITHKSTLVTPKQGNSNSGTAMQMSIQEVWHSVLVLEQKVVHNYMKGFASTDTSPVIGQTKQWLLVLTHTLFMNLHHSLVSQWLPLHKYVPAMYSYMVTLHTLPNTDITPPHGECCSYCRGCASASSMQTSYCGQADKEAAQCATDLIVLCRSAARETCSSPCPNIGCCLHIRRAMGVRVASTQCSYTSTIVYRNRTTTDDS